MSTGLALLVLVIAFLLCVTVYDLVQRKHAILRNFPVIGHLRYILEGVGPELRQYIVTNNNEERPFSRDERRWIYTTAKKGNSYFGFGTDNEIEHTANYLILKQSAFPLDDPRRAAPDREELWPVPCAKVLGGPRGRARAFRPASVVNGSAMSYGSLSGRAVEAINRGAALAGFLHNTGEGGIADHHRHGGELIWQLGTGYFGARTPDGRFSLERLLETAASAPVRAIEIKLSQGAKPGLGGVLPAAKVTAEIAAIRGIPVGQDCLSPAAHRAFGDVDEMLDFVELIAERTGLPVGIKSAVGEIRFWEDLAEHMAREARGVDYIAIDGGEGGTGAAPLAFSDHVALPFKTAFPRVYRVFAERGVAQDVVWIGAGRLGLPVNAMFAFSLGCDMVALARELMLSIGCIQAQRCHSGHCPTGVATQNPWLVRGLDPTDKAVRCAHYVIGLRKELLRLSRACGVPHPGLVTSEQVEVMDGHLGSTPVADMYDYEPDWGLPDEAAIAEIRAIMASGAAEGAVTPEPVGSVADVGPSARR